ncbi:MAG: carbonic anhydrase [Symploca sp. SIO3C6]|uniref:carbonic anhydrase n=1 Tax=Symploca sp. SIO1C4 TaxID=2607765 RepID=A0A6B3NH09_9CYAN|nr:carbonic anhydrase [Symploca sp. SIO3C6]NER31007.1 carbonic anhydrase [Symploca sp. SIO1C4]
MNRKNQQVSFSRRKLLKFGGASVGTGLLTTGIGSNLVVPEPVVAQNNMSPDQALEKLMAGNRRFIERKRQNPNQDTARLTEVAKGQAPFASILSCADSRVPPEIVFDQGLGDLFVVRDAGNVATPEEIGSLEFGTLILGSKVLMVLGHEECGAVKAAVAGAPVPGQISSILFAITPAIAHSEGEAGNRVDNAVKANVLLQMERLEKSTVISGLIEEKKLKLVGGRYDLNTGEVTLVA